ncbi:hypothetical protein Leryth_022012 [Lithospermum erythrorhizon]|nr:hypothetical protein Leryth_022012 [Lithospermum erythrorhizon]
MDSKQSSNKIREIVRLQQLLKKWKKLAHASKIKTNNTTKNNSNSTGSRSIKFLKKTLSFTEISMSSNSSSIGRDEENKKKFVIPMEYLGHQAFAVLLREAEEEFGFQQEGVLKIPCEVAMFEKILKMMQQKKKNDVAMFLFLHENFNFGTTEQRGALIHYQIVIVVSQHLHIMLNCVTHNISNDHTSLLILLHFSFLFHFYNGNIRVYFLDQGINHIPFSFCGGSIVPGSLGQNYRIDGPKNYLLHLLIIY